MLGWTDGTLRLYGDTYTDIDTYTSADWSELRIDRALSTDTYSTTFTDVKTPVIWVNFDSIAIGNGQAMADPIVDQRGELRLAPSTIGAYEKRIETYYYQNTGDVTIEANWETLGGDTPASFMIADGIFVFDDDAGVNINTDWTVGFRNLVKDI